MVLTRAKWPNAVLMTAAGAHYRHSGPGRAAMWARVWLTLAAAERLAPQGREAREREKETPETRVVADGVEGVSVEADERDS